MIKDAELERAGQKWFLRWGKGSSSRVCRLGGEEVLQGSRSTPFYLDRAARPGEHLWFFQDRLYVTVEQDLTAQDVLALLNEKENRKRMKLEKAHALQAVREQSEAEKGRPKGTRSRTAIPQSVKVAVWQRDGGHCVECGSQEKLEFDHIIPLSMGGANTERNLQLLCAPCNRSKGATLG